LTEKKTISYALETALPAMRYDTIQAVGGKSFVISPRNFGIAYLWNPATGLNSNSIQRPTANITRSAAYTVTIQSSAGCYTTDSVYIKVISEGEIYVALGFTPNGDGLNDRAYPILVGIRQLNYFKIFNRWGNLVFQTNDASPQNGWDGKSGGKIQNSGAYTWTAEGIDGTGTVIRRTGSLNLIY
jgi:gliding motility-associated-like protein